MKAANEAMRRPPALDVNAATAGVASPPDERFERAADVIDRLSSLGRELRRPSCTENGRHSENREGEA